MTSIQIEPDCGNSPKMAFLRDLNIAFMEGNMNFLEQCFSDDITWEIVGDKILEGKQALMEELARMTEYFPDGFKIFSIVTHGREAAARGEMTMSDKSVYAFCDFYEFVSAGSKSVRRMTSLIVKIS